MTLQARIFHCQIDTPDGPVLDEDIVSIKLPIHDGYMGIFANHAPEPRAGYRCAGYGPGFAGPACGPGEKTLPQQGLFAVCRQRSCYPGGRMYARGKTMPVEKLDMEAAWNLLQRAYKMPRDTDEQRALRDEAIAAGRIRFALVPKTDDKTVSLAEAMSKGL